MNTKEAVSQITQYEMGAIKSADGRYRYLLWRWLFDPQQCELLPEQIKTICFIMLNPSTANGTEDDPTIRRCKDFARLWGYQRLFAVNLFAYITPDPRELKTHLEMCDWQADGITMNDLWIDFAGSRSDLLVMAWGAQLPNECKRRYVGIYDLLAYRGFTQAKCLGRCKSGSPRHPLMMSRNTTLIDWEWEWR